MRIFPLKLIRGNNPIFMKIKKELRKITLLFESMKEKFETVKWIGDRIERMRVYCSSKKV